MNREPIFGSGVYWLIAIPAFLGIAGCAIAAIVIPGAQIARWLKTGEWAPMTVGMVLSNAGVKPSIEGWTGANLILSWLLGLHASFGFAAAIVPLFIIAAWAADRAGDLDGKKNWPTS